MTDSTTETPQLLSLADIADLFGLTAASVRTYHNDANRRRSRGEPRPQDLPAPDLVIGRTPAWKPETVESWRVARQEAGDRNVERSRQPRGPRTPASES